MINAAYPKERRQQLSGRDLIILQVLGYLCILANKCIKHFGVSQPKLTTNCDNWLGGRLPPLPSPTPPHRRWGDGTQRGFVREVRVNRTCEEFRTRFNLNMVTTECMGHIVTRQNKIGFVFTDLWPSCGLNQILVSFIISLTLQLPSQLGVQIWSSSATKWKFTASVGWLYY